MTLAAKGLVGLGSIAAVASAAVPATIFFNKKPPFKTATLTNYREGNYKGKYANHFGKHFVTAEEANKNWWDKSFERLSSEKTKQQNTLSSSFQAVTEGFGTDTTKSLNKLCETYHSKTYEEINTGSQNGQSSTLKDFWKFCTTVEAELELISSPSTGTIGNKYKSVLIAAGKDKNKKFWDTQELVFFETPITELPTSNNSIFRALYNSKDHKGSRKSLSEACEEKYSLKEGESEVNEVVKFCSISAQTTAK